jgi:hypothetical protein
MYGPAGANPTAQPGGATSEYGNEFQKVKGFRKFMFAAGTQEHMAIETAHRRMASACHRLLHAVALAG